MISFTSNLQQRQYLPAFHSQQTSSQLLEEHSKFILCKAPSTRHEAPSRGSLHCSALCTSLTSSHWICCVPPRAVSLFAGCVFRVCVLLLGTVYIKPGTFRDFIKCQSGLTIYWNILNSYKEVRLKVFCLPEKSSCSPADNAKTPRSYWHESMVHPFVKST